MATTQPPPPGRPSLARAILTARIDERLIAPFKRSPVATRILFVASVVIVLGLHALIVFTLLSRDRVTASKPVDQETAVEIVTEPPPPPPPPPQEKPASKPTIEKPASSAPRAETESKAETEQLDKETHAPKAPTPPADGKPEPETHAAAPETPPEEPDKTPAEASKPDETKDAEALDKATPEKKPDPKPAKAAKPPVKTRAAQTALQQLAGTSSLPDYKFAKPTKKSPVTGGTEDARYLAIVYGLVMRNFHPSGNTSLGGGSVTVAFEVDGDGTVLGVSIQQRSGDDALDAAALAAVSRASPLPPPPPGSPHGLIARMTTAGRE